METHLKALSPFIYNLLTYLTCGFSDIQEISCPL